MAQVVDVYIGDIPGINICSCFIQDQDLIVPDNGTSQAYQLPLACTEVASTLIHR
jgi:hypothetical protein